MERVSLRARAFVLTGLSLVLVAAASLPAEAGRPQTRPTVDLGSAAGLAPDGRSVAITVLASCPERWNVLEAIVTVSQPQASGQAGFPLTCSGSISAFSVLVPATEGTFELGEAQASAFVVIARGRTEEAQDSAVISVDPTVSVDIADTALLQAGGTAVLIDVASSCPVGAAGQQSYVSVSQGSALGSGTFVPTCDGETHTSTIEVPASQGTFQPGAARALSFVFVEAGGDTFSGVDDTPITLEG